MIIGAPTAFKNQIATYTNRAYFGPKDKFAYSLEVSMDLESKVTAVNLPIYLYKVELGKQTMQAGIRLTQTGFDTMPTMGFFITSPFSL